MSGNLPPDQRIPVPPTARAAPTAAPASVVTPGILAAVNGISNPTSKWGLNTMNGAGALAVSLYGLSLLLVGMAIAYITKNETMLNTLIAVVATNATGVFQFWIGSSSSAAQAHTTIAQQLPPTSPN